MSFFEIATMVIVLLFAGVGAWVTGDWLGKQFKGKKEAER